MFFNLKSIRLVDKLPVVTVAGSADSTKLVQNPSTEQIELGYRLGRVEGDNVHINNHLKFVLSFRKNANWFSSGDNYRVVGFQVEPMSVNHEEISFEGDVCTFPAGARSQAVSGFPNF